MRWIAVLLTGAMVALRVRTVGWFLVMLWPLYLVWAGVHLIIVLQYLIGNNAISRGVQEHWGRWFTLAGMGLAVVYGLQLIQITRRERDSRKGARSA